MALLAYGSISIVLGFRIGLVLPSGTLCINGCMYSMIVYNYLTSMQMYINVL